MRYRPDTQKTKPASLSAIAHSVAGDLVPRLDAVAELGCSERTFDRRTDFPKVTIGRRVYMTRADLDAVKARVGA